MRGQQQQKQQQHGARRSATCLRDVWCTGHAHAAVALGPMVLAKGMHKRDWHAYAGVPFCGVGWPSGAPRRGPAGGGPAGVETPSKLYSTTVLRSSQHAGAGHRPVKACSSSARFPPVAAASQLGTSCPTTPQPSHMPSAGARRGDSSLDQGCTASPGCAGIASQKRA